MRAQSKQILEITLSGFRKDQKYEDYINTLKKLYCEEPGVLNKNTDVVCTTTIHSQKCKIARVLKDSKIRIIKKEWMYQVHAKQKKVDPKSFEVKSLFYGLKLGLAGFDQSESRPIIQKLNQQDGSAEIIDLNKIDRNNNLDCIMISRRFFQLPESIQQLDIPVVNLEWYDRCLTKQQFVFPADYAINYDIICLRSDIPRLTLCAAKARQILKSTKLNDQNFNIFKDMVFYLHRFEDKSNKQTKQIITSHGGYCLDQISCFHTHILCTNYSDEDYNKFLRYGNNVKIMKLNWLLDCIITESALPEEDYLFKKYKIKITQGPTPPRPSVSDTNSMSLHANRNSISMDRSMLLRKGSSFTFPNQQLIFGQESNTYIQSKIFEKKKFFFYKEQYAKQHLRSLIKMVKSNSGSIPKLISKNQTFYLVLPDSKENKQKFQEFKNKSFSRIINVSYRWIEHCVNYGEQLNPTEPNRFIFRPFMKSTPMGLFYAVKCDMIGYDDLEQKRIKQLLKVIGASSDIYKKREITHVICKENKYKDHPLYLQYKELKQRNPDSKLKFVKLEWFLDNIDETNEILDTQYQIK